MATTSQEDQKKEVQPQLVKLNKAFHMAEQWVNNMSKASVNNKSTPTDLEGRPARLGIGAIVPKEYKPAQANNPLERRLLSSLNANKKRNAMRDEELKPSAKDAAKAGDVSEEEDGEEESKAKAFAKRKPLDSSSSTNAKKKQK